MSQFFYIQPFFLGTFGAFLLSFIPGIIYLRIKNIAILDVFWPLFFLVHLFVNFIYFDFSSFSYAQYIGSLLVLLWGMILFFKLYLRGKKHNFYDKRYDSITANWNNKNIAGICYCNFQSLIASIFCISLQFLYRHDGSLGYSLIGVLIMLIGLLLEIIADEQLRIFKNNKQTKSINSKTFCTKGLWSYSRHPNYFGECFFWIGFSITCFIISLNILSFILPLLLIMLFLYITIPIAEKLSLKKYGEPYNLYQQNTPILFPVKFRK